MVERVVSSRATVRRDKPLQGQVANRPHRAKAPLRPQHVERYPPLIEGNQKPAKEVIQRVDLVQEPERIRLTPGQVLPADAQKERPFSDVKIPLKELQLVDLLVHEVRTGQVFEVDEADKLAWVLLSLAAEVLIEKG